MVNPAFAKKAMENQIARIEMQKQLVESIALWAGKLRAHGYDTRMMNKKFFLDFDLTVHEALAQPTADMESIKKKVENET